MLQIIVLAMVMFGVANAVNMAVFERTGEFGTMRAVGDNARKIFSLVLVEGAVLGLVGSAVPRPFVALSQPPARAGMPLAMGLVLVSLVVVISRKKALTQVIGFLMLENALALLAVLGTYGIPFIVEIGVFLDVLMGFLVMQIFVYRIHETFDTIDVEQLNRLRH